MATALTWLTLPDIDYGSTWVMMMKATVWVQVKFHIRSHLIYNHPEWPCVKNGWGRTRMERSTWFPQEDREFYYVEFIWAVAMDPGQWKNNAFVVLFRSLPIDQSVENVEWSEISARETPAEGEREKKQAGQSPRSWQRRKRGLFRKTTKLPPQIKQSPHFSWSNLRKTRLGRWSTEYPLYTPTTGNFPWRTTT